MLKSIFVSSYNIVSNNIANIENKICFPFIPFKHTFYNQQHLTFCLIFYFYKKKTKKKFIELIACTRSWSSPYAKHNENIKWHFINCEENKKRKFDQQFCSSSVTFGIIVRANKLVMSYCNMRMRSWSS